MEMHCERVNTSTATSCAAIDCGTLSSLVEGYCGNSKGRPALCDEYPARIVSKYVGIPEDLERIATTVAEDQLVASASVPTMRNILTLVTTVAASVKSTKTTVAAELLSFTQHSTAASATYKRYKAAVDSKSAAQLSEAPKLLEAARSDFAAAAALGESLVKRTAELREHERKLTASVRGGDTIAREINLYASDANNAALVMADALRSGAAANADAEPMAHVKALHDQAVQAAKDAAKAAKEADDLTRKAHLLAEMPAGYDVKDAESRASAADEAQKRKLDEVKRTLAGLSGTSANLCDKPMLERAWKASAKTSPAHGEGLVPVVLHTLDPRTLGQACPFLKASLGSSGNASGPATPSAPQSVDIGLVPFTDLDLEILVLVESGPKCDSNGCGYTFFVNQGGGFIKASGAVVTPALAGFARRGVDIFAILASAEWKLERAPGKPPELVFSRAR
jgi:hypothetical protein